MNQYEILIIGAGPGGYEAAIHAGKLGKKVAVVDCREAGGTCLNRGCIPTKTLLHSSELYHEIQNGAAIGVTAETVRADLPAMFARKNEVTAKLRAGIEALFKSAKVDFLRGKGQIVGPNTVTVTNDEGVQTYTADAIIAATGSVPARPPIPGLDLEGVMTSDELLEGTDRLFDSLTIIGGGVIGVEFATFFTDLGCKVNVVEGLDRLLPNMDKELGQNLAMILKKRGVNIQTNAMVAKVEKTETGMAVHYTQKDKPGVVESEVVLCAIGRSPYWQGLFAAGIEPETERRRLKVDEHFRTSVPGVWAIGDVSSKVQLAHVATAQGIACVDEICGLTPSQDLSLVPGCIYCRPEIASVGLTEAEAKERGLNVKVAKSLMSANGRTVIVDGDRGFMKLVADAETGKLLGAHLMCERATDMISQLSVAIANGLTVDQLRLPIRPHPTFEEAMTDALADLKKKLG